MEIVCDNGSIHILFGYSDRVKTDIRNIIGSVIDGGGLL